MLTENNTEIGNIGISPFKAMFIKLLQLGAELRNAADDNTQGEVLERHWAVREKIAATPALSLHDAIWRARAAEIERQRDPDFTNDVPGSAAHLASLVVADMILFAGSAA
jgi:hypothetical protein